jgi:hypothetical protein
MFRSERRARCEAKMRGEDPGEMRTSSARAADALVEMARRAAATTAAEDSGATVTPAQPLVLVNIDVATELDADGEVRKVLSARLGDGTPISTQDAVRLACDAAVARVLTKRGVVPLQLGRLARDPSDGQRRALGAIWATCAHPSCDRPFAWCDLHHVLHWELGGRTDVDLLLPLCKHHHRMHHRDVFRIERRPDSTFLFKHADGTPIGAANPTISQLFAAARHITRAA